MSVVRVGPVHFQSLEHELEPVTEYLSGSMLNAGCGTRNIEPFLRRRKVTHVTRYDIASDDPAVVIGPLEHMPFDNGTFDSALCNAVLEHVADPARAMRELGRVVKPGGHVVVAVPFLQPFHACPGDFQRYTIDGLTQLGRAAGLEVVSILPVHSIAQTIGWILWEYACEKGGRLRRLLAWTTAFVLTRVWNRTDPAVVRNANTLQAVFRVAHVPEAGVIGTAWRQAPVPAASAAVPTMLLPDELRLLHHLGQEYYSGAGAIVEGGAFLGGSTVALADGVRRNRLRRRSNVKPIHTFDRFEVEEYTRHYFADGRPAGASFLDEFRRNIAPYDDLVEVHPGDIMNQRWSGEPIEILFVDVAKSPRLCDWVIWQFFGSLIPGRSLVIQQDYLYQENVAWLYVAMEVYADYFEYVCDTELNSVVFLHVRAIPPSALRPDTVERLSIEEQRTLMDRAAAKFSGRQREVMLAAKADYLRKLEASLL